MELPTTTPVDNLSEEGDNEDGIRGDSPPSPPKRFNGGFDTEGEGFQIGDPGGNNRCARRQLRRRRNRRRMRRSGISGWRRRRRRGCGGTNRKNNYDFFSIVKKKKDIIDILSFHLC